MNNFYFVLEYNVDYLKNKKLLMLRFFFNDIKEWIRFVFDGVFYGYDWFF